jgi:hypothetical protein
MSEAKRLMRLRQDLSFHFRDHRLYKLPNGNYYVVDSGRVVLRNVTLDDIEAELRVLTAIDAKEIEELCES